MHGVDSDLLQFDGDFLGSEHGCVWGAFFFVRSDLHASGDSAVGFAASQIGHVDESIVESRQDVHDSEDEFVRANGGAELLLLLVLLFDDFFDLRNTNSTILRLLEIFIF